MFFKMSALEGGADIFKFSPLILSFANYLSLNRSEDMGDNDGWYSDGWCGDSLYSDGCCGEGW